MSKKKKKIKELSLGIDNELVEQQAQITPINAEIDPNTESEIANKEKSQILLDSDQIKELWTLDTSDTPKCNGAEITEDIIKRVPMRLRVEFREDLVKKNRSEFCEKWNRKLNSYGLFCFE